jgi:hypothetical protein
LTRAGRVLCNAWYLAMTNARQPAVPDARRPERPPAAAPSLPRLALGVPAAPTPPGLVRWLQLVALAMAVRLGIWAAVAFGRSRPACGAATLPDRRT